MPPEEDTAQEQPVEETSIAEDIGAVIAQMQSESDSDTDDTDDHDEDDIDGEDDHEDGDDEDQEDDEESLDEDDDEEEEGEIEAPYSWNKKAKKMFSGLPTEAREYIAKREKEQTVKITQTTQELSDLKKQFEGLEQILKPRRKDFALSGLDDVAAVRQLFAIADSLQENPAETLQVLAGQFGVDLKTIGQGNDEDDETTDPALKEIKKINNRLDQKDDDAKKAKGEQLAKFIQNFENAKDEEGELLHPRFGELKKNIFSLITSGMAKNLDEAYEKAVMLNPKEGDTKKTGKSKNKEAEKAKKAKRTAQAKKASQGVNSSSSKSGKKELSLKDELREAIGSNTLRI